MTEGLLHLSQGAAQWLLTYLVHSTLLLGLALLVSWGLRQRALWLQEGLLRGALLGGLLTASLHPAVAPPPPEVSAVRIQVPREVRAPGGLKLSLQPPLPPSPAVAAPTSSFSLRAPAGRWQLELVLTSLALSLLLLVRYLLAWRRLHRVLADRVSVRDPAVRGLLAPLLAAARIGPVRLVSSGRVTVPLALGARRPEICLPERALVELPLDDLRGILAHEVAHLARRDPAWRILLRLIADGLPLQPLNRLAAQRLQTLAEYQCDDFSAERTGRPLVLARSLTEVAGWLLGRHGAQEVPGALGTESELSSRVRRLIAWEKRSEPMAKSAYVFGLSGALLVGVIDSLAVDAARDVLKRLRGKTHILQSAIVACMDGAPVWRHLSQPRLRVRNFSDAFLEDYLDAIGEAAFESVGCYQVEGRGALLFDRIEGDYFSILGMPLLPLLQWLRDRGVVAT